MYGDMPNNWSPELSGLARLRFISNAFTRMRYCFPNGSWICQRSAGKRPCAVKPWFAIPGPVSNEYSIVFGHWLRWKAAVRRRIYALDTGAAGAGSHLPALGRQAVLYSSPQTGRKSRTKARRSPPEKSRITVSAIRISSCCPGQRYALPGMPSATFRESRSSSYASSAHRHREIR